jgi:hypothetical protein
MGDPSALPRLRVFHNGTDVTKTTNYKIPSHSILRLTVPQNFILLTFAIKDTERIFHYYFSPHSSYRHVTQFLANFCVFCEHKIIILSVSNFKGDTKVGQCAALTKGPIVISFSDPRFVVTFDFEASGSSQKYPFAMWFSRGAEAQIALNTFAGLLTHDKRLSFPPELLMLTDSDGKLVVPGDDLAIEAANRLAITIVSSTITYSMPNRGIVARTTISELLAANAKKQFQKTGEFASDLSVQLVIDNRLIFDNENLAYLRSSEENPIHVDYLKTYRVKLEREEGIIELQLCERETVKAVKRKLLELRRRKIGALCGYYKLLSPRGIWRGKWEYPDDELLCYIGDEYPMEAKEIDDQTVAVLLSDGRELTFGVNKTNSVEDLVQKVSQSLRIPARSQFQLFCQDGPCPARTAVTRIGRVFYFVSHGMMDVRVCIGDYVVSLSVPESARVSELLSPLEQSVGPGPWEFSFGGFDCKLDPYLCPLLFRQNQVFSACRPGVKFIVQNVIFTATFQIAEATVAQLWERIKFNFVFEDPNAILLDGESPLGDPKQRLSLDSLVLVVKADGPVSRKVSFDVGTGRNIDLQFGLAASTAEVLANFAGDQFFFAGQPLLLNPQLPLSSVPLFDGPIHAPRRLDPIEIVPQPSVVARRPIPVVSAQLVVPPLLCNFILPPDDSIVEQTLDGGATVAEAVAVARRLLPTAHGRVRLCDADGRPLSPDIAPQSLPEPRDLCVQPVISCEIVSRVHGRFVDDFPADGTVSDVLEAVQLRHGPCKLATWNGEILALAARIGDTDRVFVSVPSGSACVVSLEIHDRAVGEIEVDSQANAEAFVRSVATVFGFDKFAGSVVDSRGLIDRAACLADVRGPLRLVNELPPPQRAAESGGRFVFECEGEEFELAIPVQETVLGTKGRIAQIRHTVPEYVSLFFAGRDLPDTWLLSRQRGAGHVIVTIRSMDALLLQSVGYGSRRGPPKPPDFVDRVNRLEAETGKDRRTCSRCLMFFEYDTERALAALQGDLDD